MARSKRGLRPVNWDALELEAFNLEFEQMSAEDKLKKAHGLAAIFRRHLQPVPDCLADLIRRETTAISSTDVRGLPPLVSHHTRLRK